MICTKCKGLMVHEQFRDYLGTRFHCDVMGWRCVSCGLRHDLVIQSRQINRKEEVKTKFQSA